MGDLIKRGALLSDVLIAEGAALAKLQSAIENGDLTSCVKWSAVMKERAEFKKQIMDASTVEAIPIEWLKEHCSISYLRKVQCIQDILGDWEKEKRNGETD